MQTAFTTKPVCAARVASARHARRTAVPVRASAASQEELVSAEGVSGGGGCIGVMGRVGHPPLQPHTQGGDAGPPARLRASGYRFAACWLQ